MVRATDEARASIVDVRPPVLRSLEPVIFQLTHAFVRRRTIGPSRSLQAVVGSVHAVMRWLQLRFDFDSTAVRLHIKGH